MPRKIPVDEVLSILRSGGFDALIGGLEDEHLECKGAPYRFADDAEKMEFAKDISALANANGGIILLGVTTERDLTFLGDAIRSFGCFEQSRVDIAQYHNIALEWVIPPIRGLRLKWHPTAEDCSAGIVSIVVPASANEDRPYIVNRVLSDSGKVAGAYIGYFERTRGNATPMRAAELRERLKDGLRFAELSPRMTNIEAMVADLARTRDAAITPPPQTPEETIVLSPTPSPPPLDFDSDIFRRVQAARRALNPETVPTFSLCAWPKYPVSYLGLFRSRTNPIVRLLEDPPALRSSGFNISINRESTIVEGRLRRCLAPGFRLLEIWRDGPSICIVEGGDGHLCWGSSRTGHPDLQINNIALTETTYLFCDWALKVFEHAEPRPVELKFRIMFANMNLGGHSFALSNVPLTHFTFGARGRTAPMAEGQHFEIDADATMHPGVIAYLLLADVYNWFGFDSDSLPYADRHAEPFAIDPTQLRATS